MSSANELQEQGVKFYEQRDYEAAARMFLQAKEAYDLQGDEDLAAEMLTNLGLVHRALGENQQALEVMQKALRVFQEREDQQRAAQDDPEDDQGARQLHPGLARRQLEEEAGIPEQRLLGG